MRSIFGLTALLLVLLAGCNSANKLMGQVQSTGVGYDTVKDPNVPGRYEGRATIDTRKGAEPGNVGMQALLNAVEAAQRDGYDLVTVAGPRGGTLTRTLTSRSSSSVIAKYPVVVFDVQGYKSAGDHPPNARPAAAFAAEIVADIAKHQTPK